MKHQRPWYAPTPAPWPTTTPSQQPTPGDIVRLIAEAEARHSQRMGGAS